MNITATLAGIFRSVMLSLSVMVLSLPTAARAQTAYFSATGSFTATDGAFQTLNLAQLQASDLTARTWAYSGGVNAAGQTIAPGGIDSLLTLSVLPGGSVLAQNDNISETDRDSLIQQPALPAGQYAVRTERAAPGGGSGWATDVVNGAGSLTLTAMPSNLSQVQSVALGATGTARSTLQLTTPNLTIPGSLDVQSGGVVQINSGSHSVQGGTIVRTGGRLTLNSGIFRTTGLITVDGGLIEDFGQQFNFIDAPLRVTNGGVANLRFTPHSLVMDNGASLSAAKMVVDAQDSADIGGAGTRFALQGFPSDGMYVGAPVTIHSGAAGSITNGQLTVRNFLRVQNSSLTLVNSSVDVASESFSGVVIVEGPGARFAYSGTGSRSINIAVWAGEPTPPPGTGRFIVDDGAVFTAAGTVTIGSRGMLEVRNGATTVIRGSLSMRPQDLQGPGAKLIIGGGSGAWTGRLDLTTVGAFLLPSPAAGRAEYIDQLRSGRNGGAWDGFGIVSSDAAANPGFALGYRGSFDMAIIYTRYGDADLNRAVNLNDFDLMAANFGFSGLEWGHGDFNYDRVVNLDDFNLLAANFGLTASGPDVTPHDWAALAAAVPEPVALVGTLPGLALLLRRRLHGRPLSSAMSGGPRIKRPTATDAIAAISTIPAVTSFADFASG